jgi:caffeoyl-CoA O-methyltransferase
MQSIVPEALEQYAAEHTDAPPPLLEKLRQETYAHMASPQMQVGRLEGAFLKMMVRVARARRVLEIGTFTGYSALSMAEGLPEDGELITCDVDPKAEAVARRYFQESPHGRKIQLRMGPALNTVASLKGPFDLVFIDADKTSYSAYYEAVLPLVRQGGLILADNTLWDGRVLHPSSDDDRAIVAFNQKVASDPRVERVLVTIRDGVMMAWKR